MLEGGGVGNTRGEGVKTPQLIEKAEDGSMRVLSSIVGTLVLNETGADPWGNEKGRDSDTKTLEVEGSVLAIVSNLGVCDVVASWDTGWGRDVIAETSVLVKGQDEKGLLPLGTVADGLVDPLDEVLSEGDWGRWVEGIVAAALWVDVAELG
jgi:hypothetical protein